MKAKILFVSSSVGLGHVTRDYRLSRELARWADVTWLTAGAAARYLEARGERLHPLSKELRSIGESLMRIIRGCRVRVGPLSAYALYRDLRRNADLIRDHLDLEEYDVVVGDEPWELIMSGLRHARSALITDFEAFEASGRLSRLAASRINSWLRARYLAFALRYNVGLWGAAGPGFRRPGNLFTHDGSYPEPEDGDSVVVNVGGTDAASELAARIAEALRGAGEEVEVIGSTRGFTSDPLKAMARARVIVTLAGYGSLVEVAAMRKRAVILEIDGHFEHGENARLFAGRRGYRVMMCSEAAPGRVLRAVEEVEREEPEPPRVTDAAGAIAAEIRGLAEQGT